ncbi:MAG: hypothetical protein EG828_07995 [Deltaproteobacteria bacterium]|nr:hypothetical protein [Deltaproteobacteria bacterium]
MRLKKNFFLPSLGDMLFLSIFLYLSVSKGSALLGDCDTGYHIRAGEWILSHLAVPRQDMFSYLTPPLPWTAHEWLSEVIMVLIHHVSGLTGLVILFTSILALVSLMLFQMLRNEGGNILLAIAIVLLATASSQVHWLARPHVFSLLLFLVWYRILEDYRLGAANRLYLLPPVLLLWVNLHGGYVAGFLLLAIYLVGGLPECFSGETGLRETARQRLKKLAAITAICIPVSCINPYGWHILLFPFNLVSNKLIMDSVTEFLSPNFHEPSPFKYLLMLLLTVLALSRQKLRLVELLLLLAFLNMSLFSVRYIPLFAIIAAPIIMRHGDTLLRTARGSLASLLARKADSIAATDASSGGMLWPMAAVAAVTWIAASGTIQYGFDPSKVPAAAVRFIEKANLQGNMFNDDEFGDYVIYAAWPRYKVFFDGRSDMYGPARLKEYMQVVNFEEGWGKTLDKYRTNWIFINTKSKFARFLKERKDWVLIYEDKVAVIFIRNCTENRTIIEKHRHPLVSG